MAECNRINYLELEKCIITAIEYVEIHIFCCCIINYLLKNEMSHHMKTKKNLGGPYSP